jgi:hypothetical protein
MWVANYFLKNFKTQLDTSLNKAQHKQELLCGKIFLTRPENFVEKFLAMLGFVSGVIAFLPGLIVTITWLHFLVPLGFNVNVSSFLLMLSFMILATT